MQVALGVIEALCYCHSLKPEPVLHLDLKTENILLSAGEDFQVKLCDFGSAMLMSGTSSFTKDAGTEYYRAPEVRDNAKVNARTREHTYVCLHVHVCICMH